MKKSQGFTLIELMIVVSIMLLGLGFAITRYSFFHEAQRVKQASNALASDLSLAHNSAVSGKKPVSCLATEMLVGYKVTFSTSSYSVVPQCSSSGDITGTATTVTLPSGITFALPVPSSFVYYPMTQGTSLTSDVTLGLTDGITSLTVTIDKATGEVNK